MFVEDFGEVLVGQVVHEEVADEARLAEARLGLDHDEPVIRYRHDGVERCRRSHRLSRQ